MLLKAFGQAIAVAHSVDHDRLAKDEAYRQRIVDMLGVRRPKSPSLTRRLVAAISRYLPKAA